MQIPKTMSSPADPDAPSFLTTLPAEIRNTVYEVLFKPDGPVLLHDSSNYHVREPLRQDYLHSDFEFNNALEDFDVDYEKEIGEASEFEHGFEHGIRLLQSCRQIYHEATGVLYGSNHFIISRALDRCDDDDTMHDTSYHQFIYAPKWLSGLGSQLAILKRVTIDIDAMCPLACPDLLDDIDLLPLARILWKQQASGCSITFGHTGRKLPMHNSEQQEEKQDAGNFGDWLSNVMNTIVTKDTLQLKRYIYWDHLIRGISLWPLENAGQVCYKSGPNTYGTNTYSETSITFEIGDGGKKVTANDRDPKPELFELPHLVRTRIYEFASYSAGCITFDLDTRTAHGLNMGALQFGRIGRVNSEIPSIISQTQDIMVKVTSSEVVTNFSDFYALVDLTRLRQDANSRYNRNNLRDIVLPTRYTHKLLTIALNLEVAVPTTLYDIRIDIKTLLYVFSYTEKRPRTMLRISLSCPRGNSMHKEQIEISLAEVQKNAFLVLYDVLEQLPQDLPQERKERAPQLWINGYGTIINARYPETMDSRAFTINNRHTTLRKNEVVARGYRMAARRTELMEPGARQNQESLQHACSRLIALHWNDVYLRRPYTPT